MLIDKTGTLDKLTAYYMDSRALLIMLVSTHLHQNNLLPLQSNKYDDHINQPLYRVAKVFATDLAFGEYVTDHCRVIL